MSPLPYFLSYRIFYGDTWEDKFKFYNVEWKSYTFLHCGQALVTFIVESISAELLFPLNYLVKFKQIKYLGYY